MLKRLMYILLMTVLLATNAVAQESYVIDKVCKGAVRTYRIDGEKNSTYTWLLTDPSSNPVVLTNPTGTDFTDTDADGNPIQGSEIEITWDMNPGIYTLKAEQRNGNKCSTLELGTIEVVPQAVVFAGNDQSACLGSLVTLNEATATDYATLQWTTSGDGTFNDNTILNPTYTPGTADRLAGSVTLSLNAGGQGNEGTCTTVVDQMMVSLKSVIAVITTDPVVPVVCQGNDISVLATVTGGGSNLAHLWSGVGSEYLSATDIANPVFRNIAPAGVYTLTYSAKDEIGCETTAEVVLTVNPIIIPVFTEIGPLCQFSTPPSLPTSSMNTPAVTGTWTPDVINTDLPGSFQFTFTPVGGTCVQKLTITVEVKPTYTPTFTVYTNLCEGAEAMTLPKTSTEGITGTWDPATVSNIATGTYTFIPDAGQCANQTTLTVTVTPIVTPSFNLATTFCTGEAAPALPPSSIEGITGSWTPPIVSNTASGDYLFTPDPGQCATFATVKVNVNPETIPTFHVISSICEGTTAPVLPFVSDNGINGSWSPATVSNTTTGTYTFKPDANQCAAGISITVTVIPALTPTFNEIAAICSGSVPPVLATTSNEGIKGSWIPSIISNTETTTYNFTPEAGQCANPTTLTVKVIPTVTPAFNNIQSVCFGSTPPDLPKTSINGITGTWTPAVINTTVAGPATYTFAPDAGQCAVEYQMEINVTPLVTPTFEPIAPLCQNSTAPALPLSSTNIPAITGIWTPSSINTAVAGSVTYTFRPDDGQCAETVTMEIRVLPTVTAQFEPIGPLCLNSTPPALPAADINGLNGTWVPAAILTDKAGTTIYTFTPEAVADQCRKPFALTVTVLDLPVIKIDPVTPLCTGNAAITLKGTPEGGTFTGTAIAGNTFSPSVSGPGTFEITYQYTDPAGCSNSATIEIIVNEDPVLVITDPKAVCSPATVDLTAPEIKLGSSADLNYTYWLDANATNSIPDPTAVSAGTYYIKGTNASGCFMIMAVNVTSHDSPVIMITDPLPVCEPATVNLRADEITAGSTPGLVFTYWTDPMATIEYPTPDAAGNGTYYIKGTTPQGCYDIKEVHVVVNLSVTDPVFALGTESIRCQAGETITYTATATNATGLTYSLDALSTTGGNTIDPSTGAVTFASSWSGTSLITVSAAGCNGPKTAVHTVTTIPAPNATITYSASSYCQGISDVQVTRIGTAGGVYGATPTGLTIDPVTGALNPFTSTPATYDITYTVAAAAGCNEFTAHATVTIITSPTAKISYDGSPFCKNSDPVDVKLDGSGGGTFKANTSGLTIDPVTGKITPATSELGQYTVTYTIAATEQCPVFTTQVMVAVIDANSAFISYPGSPFCYNAAAVDVDMSGATGGQFSSTPAGLALNVNTGRIDPSASIPNTYTVSYIAAGNCGKIPTAVVIITTGPVATISYPGSPFCSSAGLINVVLDGPTGGTYSAIPNTLSIDPVTGTIDVGNSPEGTYVITYTNTGASLCGQGNAMGSTTITISSAQWANFYYPGTPYCQSSAPAKPTFEGTNTGTFDSDPGLAINKADGTITPGNSLPGEYTVTYAIPANGVCEGRNFMAVVTILESPHATISYNEPFCQGLNEAQKVNRTGSNNGVFSSTTGLSINPATGDILPSASQPGTYTVTYTLPPLGICAGSSTTATVHITSQPTATISYQGSPWCRNLETVQLVERVGAPGGTYSSDPTGLNLDPTTGAITPASSMEGKYTITYKIPASNGCNEVIARAYVQITLPPDATFSYPGSPFCNSDEASHSPSFKGTTLGTFTSDPGMPIDHMTGAIIPKQCTIGTHTVTYTIEATAGCGSFVKSVDVTILDGPTVDISYPGSVFCTSAGPVVVTITGAQGGAFTSDPAGLSINGTTGQVDPGSSQAGSYMVIYTVTAGNECGNGTITSKFPITIIAKPVATFTYEGTPYCNNGGNPVPTFIDEATAGTFTSTNGLVFVNVNTGEIDLLASTPGTYLVTNTIPAAGGCDEARATTSVTILTATVIASQPNDQIVVVPGNGHFDVAATGNNLSYQWQVDPGTGFVNITDTGVYSGSSTASLILTSPLIAMNGYHYRVIISGECGQPVISREALLTVTTTGFVLHITALGNNKVYDGTTSATVTFTDDRQPGDVINIVSYIASFDTKDAGIGKPVSVTGIIIGGPDAYKYLSNATASTTADITPAPLSVIADDKTMIYLTAVPPLTWHYAGLAAGDVATKVLPVLATTATSASLPGTYPITISGASDPNYAISFVNGTLTVTEGKPTPVIIWDNPKDIIYGTLLDSTQLNARAEIPGTFQYTPPAGTLLNAGPNQSLYVKFIPTDTSSYPTADKAVKINVLKKPITVTAVVTSKVYDGTAASAGKPLIAPAVVKGDTPLFIQTYDNKNAGTGKTLTPYGKVNSQNGGDNYDITFVTNHLGIITPLEVPVLFTAANKTYDGNTIAQILTRTLQGLVSGDRVTVSGGTASFDTPNAGIGKPVTATGFILSGEDAANYVAITAVPAYANIYPLEVASFLTANATSFAHLSDLITLTATIAEGAPLGTGAQAAATVRFTFEGNVLRDDANNTDIPMVVSGTSLIATLTLPLWELTPSGAMESGLKIVSATFSTENINYKITPNPATTTFQFAPTFGVIVYPNPSFGENLNFQITMPLGSFVVVDLFAANGQLIDRLFSDYIPGGTSKTVIYKHDLAQGIYTYQIRTDKQIINGRVVVIREY